MATTIPKPNHHSPFQNGRFLRKLQRGLIYALLIGGSIVIMIPIFWMLSTSIKPVMEVFAIPPIWIKIPPQLENYQEALFGYSPSFAVFIKNTLIIELLALPGIVLTSALAGYSFSRLRWPGRNFTFGLLLATLMLPAAVTLVPIFIGWARLGAIDTFAPLVIPGWFGGGVFNIFLFRQFFLTIPRELEDAAKIDGASHFRIFWTIMLPLVKPALAVVSIFTFIGLWNDFFGPIIYLNSNANYTVSLGLALFKSQYLTKWNLMMAATVISIIPLIILFAVFQKQILEGANLTSGLKG